MFLLKLVVIRMFLLQFRCLGNKNIPAAEKIVLEQWNSMIRKSQTVTITITMFLLYTMTFIGHQSQQKINTIFDIINREKKRFN